MKGKKVISKKKVVAKVKKVVGNVKKVVKKKVSRQYTNKVLVKVLKVLGCTAAELGRALPVNASYLSTWLYDKGSVPLRHAVRIEELTQGKIKAKAVSPEAHKAEAKKIKALAKASKE